MSTARLSAGSANLQLREQMTPGHRTWVGSIDKTYTALVAVSLFSDLDAPAARWLPQLDERITLWQLLSHRSGLFDYMWDGETYELPEPVGYAISSGARDGASASRTRP